MENFFTEVVAYLQPPSSDARLVAFAGDEIRESKADVNKHMLQCAAYAKRHEVYLISGLVVHDNHLCLCLIGPTGELVCCQGANQLSMALRGRLTPAAKQQVVQTELGNLTLCVDTDIYYPQVLRAAALKGADVAVSVQHLEPGEDSPSRLMASVWNAAQTNNLYVMNLSGNACTVTCPAPLTRNRDGYIVRRTSLVPTRFGFNMRRLDEVRAGLPLLENLNTRLVQNYQEELKRW